MSAAPYAHPVASGIRRMLESHRRARSREDELLLFTGAWHDSIPRRLILAPDLTPSEKIVWQVIYTHCARPGVEGAWPSVSRIARLARVSRPTVHNAIDVLQIKRWMIVARRVRNEHGAVIGNFYLLHPEPLDVATTLALDPGYLAFVRRMAEHEGPSKARVRQAAIRELMLIQQGGGQAEDPFERMESAMRVDAREPGPAARAVVATARRRRRDVRPDEALPDDVRELSLPECLKPWEEEAKRLLAGVPKELRRPVLDQVARAKPRDPAAYLATLARRAARGEFLPPRREHPGMDAFMAHLRKAQEALRRGGRVWVKGKRVHELQGALAMFDGFTANLARLFEDGEITSEDVRIEESRAPP